MSCLVCLLACPAYPQQMEVKDFIQLHRGFLQNRDYSIDRHKATLELFTEEQGFTFLAEGQTEVEAASTDKGLTLLLPDKTRFLLVSHPVYGKLYWKVPNRPLKKKKHYRATLVAFDPDKNQKPARQWVEFSLSPEEALLWVDTTRINAPLNPPKGGTYESSGFPPLGGYRGALRALLPIGTHTYRVEAPFYETRSDTLQVTDSVPPVVSVSLQPVYSYLTIQSSDDRAEIWVDGMKVGRGVATSARLSEGRHRVEIKRDEACLHEEWVEIGRAEKKLVAIDLKK